MILSFSSAEPTSELSRSAKKREEKKKRKEKGKKKSEAESEVEKVTNTHRRKEADDGEVEKAFKHSEWAIFPFQCPHWMSSIH